MRKQVTGFTLIEMIIAITVASIVLSSSLSAYAVLLRNKQKMDALRQMQTQANLALSRIGDHVRDGGLAYPDGGYAADAPLLETADGAQFAFDEGTLRMLQNGSAGPLFGQDIIASGTFSVSPKEAEVGPLQRYQPRVQVKLDLSSAKNPDVTLTLQTSFSSRQY